ncbi:MAG: hypothetical protein ACOZQL_18830 [Myxococcota bacterium]
MRQLLIPLALAASACSFYAPVIGDCTFSCGEQGACPDGFTCRGAFCRPSSGPQEDCECHVGATRACGTDEGECSVGTQTCAASGRWGECAGAVGPTAEVCDGKDNDCDGLTDLGPVKTLIGDNTGPYEGYWRLHGHDAGYTMVTPLALADGGMEVRALLFDPEFNPRGQSDVIAAGDWRRVDSNAEGSVVYVGYREGGDVRLTRVLVDGALTHLGTFVDAGYDSRMQVGVNAGGVVTAWVSTEASARVAKWSRQGGPPAVHDLPPLPEGTLWYIDASTDGQYVIMESELADGGVIDAVQHVDEPTPRTLTAPYWSAARFRTRKNGQLAHLDILDLMGETKVVFYRDFLTQAADGHMVVEEAGRWHDSDFVLDDADDLIAAYVNEQTQRLVLARVEGTSSSDQQVTRFILEGVTVPITAASGNVRLAKVPQDPMYGLTWSTRNKTFARRFCAP